VTWVLDLDGVVWLRGEPVPGAADAVARLRDGGERVLFITNNSHPTVAELRQQLKEAGIAADDDDLITSAQAAAGLLEAGSTALVLGGGGVVEALERQGVEIVTDPDAADAVVVGIARQLDYEGLAAASTAVRRGARLVATNDDATFPTPDGPQPGAGAILAAVVTASATEPEIAGKPHAPIAALITARVGSVSTVVGDRPDTDGLLARRLGARFALVLTGVTERSDLPVEPEPDDVADDLAALVEA
jgi:HAD superfamily hydrolase (TIGR01450 family)